MNVIVNGKSIACADACTVIELLKQLQLNPQAVVVEKNKEIIPSAKFSNAILNEQDALELLHFVGGG